MPQKLRKDASIGLRLANAMDYCDCRAEPLSLAVFRTWSFNERTG
jgi:hypothetical protein